MKRFGIALGALLFLALGLVTAPSTGAPKKNVEYIDGVMLGEQYAVKFRVIGGSPGSSYDDFVFFVQVGQAVYEGAYRRDWALQYKPKKEDWAEGTPVQIRFEKKSAFGLIKTTFMYIRRPNSDKEVMTHLRSVTGPDGKQKCGNFYCN